LGQHMMTSHTGVATWILPRVARPPTCDTMLPAQA
jgi:hypothetical protein